MFGFTQRPRPPASALGLFICPQFERLTEYSEQVICIMAGWIIRLRFAAAHDPEMFGFTQRPRPPASALGLFICPQFERLPEHSGEVICIIAVFHCYQIKSPASTSLRRGLCARDWIRTSTPFPAPPPQGGASTNFATRADRNKNKVTR